MMISQEKSPGSIFLFIISALFFTLLTPSLLHAKTEAIVIGLIPEMNVFKQQERFQPLAAYLSQKTGIPFRLSMLSRYGNIIDRLKEEKIDAAFLGSFTGALAISQLNVEPLARPINLDGTSTYFGHIFVRKDSGIKSVADMRGKTIALVERATTAGYVFPLAWLKHQGVDNLSTYFSDLVYTGSHDAAISAVLSGEADVGAAKNTIYDLVRQENPRIDNELEILANSQRVPSNGLFVRPEIDADLKKKIKETLLTMHENQEGRQVLIQFGAQRFTDTKKDDYQPVLDLAKEAGIDLENYQYFNP